MLIGDHIVLSTGLAVLVSQRFALNVIPTITMFILINCIDFDHLFYYFLDSGRANSLVLHPLHIYASPLIFLLAMFGLTKPKHVAKIYALIAGISLHLFADALAYYFRYEMLPIILMSILGLALVLYQLKCQIKKEYFIKLTIFLLFGWLFCSLEVIVKVFITK